ncbi:hypothetical protein IAT40_007928 [Kwoniella sp. CBS 6097]
MPIPPRPIPTHPRHRHHQQQRPRPSPSASPALSSSPSPASASVVPRKLGAIGTSSSLDWRAEITLLNELDRARSVPREGSGSGINEDERKIEVGLEGLIEESRGKREKRATTATTLGFDFIPNPSIVALPDEDTDINVGAGANCQKGKSLPKSLLSATKTMPNSTSRFKPVALANSSSPPVLPLFGPSGTPATPGLIPQQAQSPSEEDEEDDWELLHIPSISQSGHRRVQNVDIDREEDSYGEDGGDEDAEEEEDVIILGEMELEDEVERLIIEETTDRNRGLGLGRGLGRKDRQLTPKVKAKAIGENKATYAAAATSLAAAVNDFDIGEE